jgi:hypothetical protein
MADPPEVFEDLFQFFNGRVVFEEVRSGRYYSYVPSHVSLLRMNAIK